MISYRRLVPLEAPLLAAHLARLPPDDRERRFFARIGSEAAARHARDIAWRRTVVVGAFERGVLRGVAELYRAGEGAELAVSVEPPLQDRGVGTELVRRALLIARNRFWGNVLAEWLPGNARMHGVAAKFADSIRTADGEAMADIAADAPSQASLLGEVAAEAVGWLSDMADRMRIGGRPAPV